MPSFLPRMAVAHQRPWTRGSQILLIELSDKAIEYAEEAGPLILHYAPDDSIVPLEILDARDFVLGAVEGVLKGRATAAS